MPDYDLPDIGLGKLEDLQESLNQTPQNIDVSLTLEYDKPVGPQVRLPEIGLSKLAEIQDDVEAIQARDWYTGPGSVSVSPGVPPVSPDIDYNKLLGSLVGGVRDVAIAAVRPPQAPTVRIPMPVPAPAPAAPRPAPAVQPDQVQPAGAATGPGPVLQAPPLEAPPLEAPPVQGPAASSSASKVGLAVGGTAAAAGVLALIWVAVKRG